MNLEYANALEIVQGDSAALTRFLQSRTLERIDTKAERLCIVMDGSRLVLRVANGKLRDFPVRESFIDKLLRWHHLNRRQLRNASNETAVSFFNDLLLAIKGESVRVYVEDGEAKTITSARYSEFFDDDIMEACKGLAIGTVSRTDKVLRIDSEIRHTFQARVGDECGFGYSIFNSETGFHSLRVSHYILRKVCANGLVVKIPIMKETLPFRVHYNVSTAYLREFLETQIANSELTRKGITLGLSRAALRAPAPQMRKRAASVLAPLRGDVKAVRNAIEAAATEWDLANVVTAYARTQPVDVRLRLEQAAGLLLFPAAAER